MISRRSHHAEKTPAYAGAPTERLKYAPSMPHWRPRMNARPQITRAEPRIRMPPWRSASPKKRKTRSVKMSATIRYANFAMSPKDAIQSFGTSSQLRPSSRSPVPPLTRRPRSFDHRDLGMGGQERLREHVVEGEYAQELDHHPLVYRSSHPLCATRRRHPLVTGHD